MKNLNQKVLPGMPVVMPDLETQAAIVAEIKAERAVVNGNRDLIARFEKKIDAVIARAWDEAKGEGTARSHSGLPPNTPIVACTCWTCSNPSPANTISMAPSR